MSATTVLIIAALEIALLAIHWHANTHRWARNVVECVSMFAAFYGVGIVLRFLTAGHSRLDFTGEGPVFFLIAIQVACSVVFAPNPRSPEPSTGRPRSSAACAASCCDASSSTTPLQAR
ncbi:hypothetical protein AYO49_00540 [Verrucomicrobiaceae bacterium SCGC AG-212-N21]|nr:hypothetical protein AYO49_00540 [Verrucomicrobiaceae bacterium SCGC AG-212-N21]